MHLVSRSHGSTLYYRHLGNRRFRELVENKKRAYLSSDFKREKRTIADSIVSAVRNLSPPGRFLAKDPRTGAWELVDDNRARDKVRITSSEVKTTCVTPFFPQGDSTLKTSVLTMLLCSLYSVDIASPEREGQDNQGWVGSRDHQAALT